MGKTKDNEPEAPLSMLERVHKVGHLLRVAQTLLHAFPPPSEGPIDLPGVDAFLSRSGLTPPPSIHKDVVRPVIESARVLVADAHAEIVRLLEAYAT